MIKKSKIAIELVNVSKKYVIHHEKPTLTEHLFNNKNEVFWALKNINIKINKGERIGIIGPNGCGKTTLLKIMTGITTPTTGTINTSGKIISLIDLSAGFHNDLTGIENIYLNGMILGMKKSEIKYKIQKIIKFANIGKFIDTPLYTYSSGMMLRLGFSIAIHSDPEILILDENVSVGDQDFIIKSSKYLNQLMEQRKTIIIASHNLSLIKNNCEKVLLIYKGKILKYGKADKVITSYINN